MIYILCVISFLFGFFICALFTVGKRADENYFAETGRTNHSKIQRMTVNEMTDLFVNGTGGFDCSVCSLDNSFCEGDCERQCKEWLLKEELNDE